MKLFISVAAVLAVLLARNLAPAQSPTAMTVVRDPGCGCCMNWVTHLRRAGFTVTVTESASRLRDTRVPAEARSCHTGSIGGYLIEGHVPAADIKKLADRAADDRGARGAGHARGPRRGWSRAVAPFPTP